MLELGQVIEVALFISISLDAAGAEENERKEMMPKVYSTCCYILGHMMNNYMTVIERWGAI